MNLTDYLQNMTALRQGINPTLPVGYHYWCMEDLVLDRGTAFNSAPLTDAEWKTLLRAIDVAHIQLQYRQCYYNSQIVATADPTRTLVYTEGYAFNQGIPYAHGWLDLHGKVVDLTWRTSTPSHQGRLRDRIVGVIPEGWQYIGIGFDTEDLIRRLVNTGLAASIIDDGANGWPLLKQDRLTPCSVGPLPPGATSFTLGQEASP